MRVQRAAVIGHPIRHTMSPFIHRRLFALGGIPMEYSVLDIGEPAQSLPKLRGYDVFNVTIPYKEALLPFLDELDGKAALFGAVNTVKVENGRMKGYITDGTGCLQAIESEGVGTRGKNVIFGNGGTARAIAFEMAYTNPDFDITIAHRAGSAGKAEKIAADIRRFAGARGRIACLPYGQLAQAGPFELAVNATKLGMYPQPDASPVGRDVLCRCGAVFDAVFNPEQTLLLRTAQELGIPAVRGIGMLVRQAAAAHEIWYGSSFEEEQLQRLCGDTAAEMNRIFYGG